MPIPEDTTASQANQTTLTTRNNAGCIGKKGMAIPYVRMGICTKPRDRPSAKAPRHANQIWLGRELNPDDPKGRGILNPLRLPIPPPSQAIHIRTLVAAGPLTLSACLRVNTPLVHRPDQAGFEFIFFISQAMFSPRSFMVWMPSLSPATSPFSRPKPMFQ